MNTTNPSQIAPLNIKEAFDRIGDLPLFREISHTFAKELPVTLTKIHNAIQANEWENAMRFSHSLKSTLAIVGAEDLREVAALLEYSCRDKQAQEAIAKLSFLDQRQDQLIQALNQI